MMGALLVAIKGGGNITFTKEDEDGRTEILTLESMGVNSDGEPLTAVSISSSDGTLAPETAEMAAELMTDSHKAEVNRLIGE